MHAFCSNYLTLTHIHTYTTPPTHMHTLTLVGTSPFTIQNLTSGSHTITVYPVGPENVDPKCGREIGKILKFEI